MIYNVPQEKIEQWKWTRPRLPVLLDLFNQYEKNILNGRATFLYADFTNAFGYSYKIREVKENNFIEIINSDISLLDPYRVDGKRIVVGFDGWSKDGRRLIKIGCIHPYQVGKITDLKLFKENNSDNNGNGKSKEFKIADSDTIDLNNILPEKYKKQLEEKLNNSDDNKYGDKGKDSDVKDNIDNPESI